MKKLTIKMKLVLAFALVALIPIAVVMAVVAVKIEAYSLGVFVNATSNELKQVDNAMSLFVDGVKANVRFLAGHPDATGVDDSLISYVDVSDGSTMVPDEVGGVDADLYHLFAVLKKTNKNFLEVFMGTRWGGWASSYTGGLPNNYDPRVRPWYRDAVAKGDAILTPAYVSLTGTHDAVFSVAAPIRDTSGGTVGVAAIDVSLAVLTDLVHDIKIGKSGFAILVQGDGTILANPDAPEMNFKKMSELGIPALKVLDGMASGHVEITKDGTDYLANVYTSPALGWKLIGVIEKGEVVAESHKLTLMILAIGGVLFILTLGAAFWLAHAVTQPIVHTSDMLRDIAEGEGDLTRRLEIRSGDEVGILATWFNAFIEKIHGVIQDLSENAESVSESGGELSRLSDAMSDGAAEMNARAGNVAASAEEMSAVMTNVAASTEQTAANVNMVAAATEEMRATISEIAESSEKARGVTSEMVGQAREVRTVMDALSEAAGEIGKVTESITEISEQTNLLALNATIEAARAGEAGKGFAVVAGEIKALAGQTAEATFEIRRRIEGVQASSSRSVEGIGQMSTVIEEVNELVGTIAAAVEEQSVSTAEIAENLAQASGGLSDVSDQVIQSSGVSGEIAEEVADVSRSATRFSEGSSTVHNRSEALAGLASNLKEVVGRFKI